MSRKQLLILCIVFTNFSLASCSNGCPEKCEIIYEPVCGSNGRTYKSSCHLRRDNCFGSRQKVKEIYKGECLNSEEDEAEDTETYNCLRIGRGKYLHC